MDVEAEFIQVRRRTPPPPENDPQGLVEYQISDWGRKTARTRKTPVLEGAAKVSCDVFVL